MERPSVYMRDMLLSMASTWVFTSVFWDWCRDTYGDVFAVVTSVAVGILKVHDVLVLSKAWERARKAVKGQP